MINTTFTVAQLIKLGREVPLKSKKFSCNGSINNTALFFLDDPVTINNDFCSEDVYYFIFLKPFISISADTAIGFSMNFELQYNYSFWPEYNDVILSSLADYSLPEGKKKFLEDDVCANFIGEGKPGVMSFT